ncbi:MAG TPA: hypothetical protein VGO50_06190 [Pyrinomonadaceae bacterium]|jgi:hypothetical protein|nr:hypothetical protein [Pyrinomonadaceae bacterium]
MKTGVRLFLNSILLAVSIIGCLHAQTQKESILERKVKIDIRATTWVAVHDLAYNGIPIGFEARKHWNVDTDPQVILHSGTVKEILDSIVKQDTFYTWEEVDGVINIHPVRDRYEKSASFLATRIGPITVSPAEDSASAVERISNLFDGGKERGIQFHSLVGRGNTVGVPEKFKGRLDIPASDVRTTLNKLTKVQPYAPLWTVTPSQDGDTILVVF